jgi:hypothetical protein
MSTYILMIVVMVWVMLFYLGFRLIDIRSDLRAVRLHMERISRKRIR